jgi:two-component system nitrogen regulation response regulator GlnG
LLKHYLAEAASELTIAAKSIDPEALEALQSYDWPGNVRQLVNASRRLTVTAPGRVISTRDIPAELGGSEPTRSSAQEWTRSLATWADTQLAASEGNALLEAALPQFEKTLIQSAMARAKGSRTEAAKMLGWGRNTLARKMKSLHLE